MPLLALGEGEGGGAITRRNSSQKQYWPPRLAHPTPGRGVHLQAGPGGGAGGDGGRGGGLAPWWPQSQFPGIESDLEPLSQQVCSALLKENTVQVAPLAWGRMHHK